VLLDRKWGCLVSEARSREAGEAIRSEWRSVGDIGINFDPLGKFPGAVGGRMKRGRFIGPDGKKERHVETRRKGWDGHVPPGSLARRVRKDYALAGLYAEARH
jgi:hypothetical protein